MLVILRAVTAALHQLALVLAVAALADAARRIAHAAGARGALETLVAGAPFAAAAAGAWSLLLALFALGGSTLLLLAGALGVWALTLRLLPSAPGTGPSPGWLQGRTALWLGAGFGALAAWVAWLVKYPELGIDSITYHLPESVMWVQQGTPGSVELIAYELPHGNYPVTSELIVSWMLGLSQSMAPSILWDPAMAVLLLLAVWLGLRRLGATRPVAGLAAAGILLVPVTSSQILGPHTDLPALAWLLVTAALCAVAAAEKRPALMVPALLAGALAVGTKTTAAPLGALALLVTGWLLRDQLRPYARWLAAVAVLGTVVGGTWYLRNWIDHGSPLWPFLETPGGDPQPRLLRLSDATFIEDPQAALQGVRRQIYWDILAGGLLCLPLGMLAPIAARRRLVVGLAAACAVATAFWLQAPFTGVPDDPRFDVSLTTTRYLAPAMAVGAAAIALALPSRWAAWLLGFIALASFGETFSLRFKGVPWEPVVVVGAIGGWVAVRLGRRFEARLTTAPALAAAAVVAVLALTAIAHNFAVRHGLVGGHVSSGAMTWLAADPRFQDGDEPVAMAPVLVGPAAGDGLEHRISLIPAREPCARVRARVGHEWLLIGTEPLPTHLASYTAADCLRDVKPAFDDGKYRVYAPGTEAVIVR